MAKYDFGQRGEDQIMSKTHVEKDGPGESVTGEGWIDYIEIIDDKEEVSRYLSATAKSISVSSVLQRNPA